MLAPHPVNTPSNPAPAVYPADESAIGARQHRQVGAQFHQRAAGQQLGGDAA